MQEGQAYGFSHGYTIYLLALWGKGDIVKWLLYTRWFSCIIHGLIDFLQKTLWRMCNCPLSQLRKRGFKKSKKPTQGHIANDLQMRNLIPGLYSKYIIFELHYAVLGGGLMILKKHRVSLVQSFPALSLCTDVSGLVPRCFKHLKIG